MIGKTAKLKMLAATVALAGIAAGSALSGTAYAMGDGYDQKIANLALRHQNGEDVGNIAATFRPVYRPVSGENAAAPTRLQTAKVPDWTTN